MLIALSGLSCTLIVDRKLRAGIGAPCSIDDECQAGTCAQGSCTAACSTDTDCPAPSLCFSTQCRVGCRVDGQCAAPSVCVDSSCASPIAAAALFGGPTNGEDGWSTANRVGLDEATTALRYMRFDGEGYRHKELLRTTEDVATAMEQFLAEGASMIVTTSPEGAAEALLKARAHPSTRFVVAGATSNGGLANVGAYSAKSEQGWYVAGRVAALASERVNKCIGLVLPTPTKAIVRETNAFVRGAKFQEPAIKVVIRWLGATKDPSPPGNEYAARNYPFKTATTGPLLREELLAAQLADLGCGVVAHRTETQRTVAFVDHTLAPLVASSTRPFPLFSLGVDARDACKANVDPHGVWAPTCLASLYWNWGPTYQRVFDQVRRGVWTGTVDIAAFRTDAAALVKLELNPSLSSASAIGTEEVDHLLKDAADAGFDAVFRGPYDFHGQRDLDGDGIADPSEQSVGAGTPLSPQELEKMCWFVDGAYELADPNVVTIEGLTPALVPYGPPLSSGSTTLDPKNPADLQKYGDVIQFLAKLGRDPASVMSCALH